MRKVFTTCALGAGLSLCLASGVSAQTSGFLFGGVDASESAAFGYVGGGVRPGGDIDSSGLMIRALAGYGEYDEDQDSDADDEGGSVTTVDLMVGAQSVGETSRFSGYIGANYQDHSVDGDRFVSPGLTGGSHDDEGEEWGVKGQVEAYAEPNPGMMLLGIAAYSTAHDTYFVLGKAGWRFGDGGVYFGPELMLHGSERYDQQRLGVHATGFRVGPLGLSASVGAQAADSDDSGVYGSVGFTARY